MKQTRGAINLLIASYKGVLKNALIASMATVALSGAANAKTIDLSDDSLFSDPVLANNNIEDDNDGSDTLVTIASNPNYNDVREVYWLSNNQGNMSFDKGGKILAKAVDLSGGTFKAEGTTIDTEILNINDKIPAMLLQFLKI